MPRYAVATSPRKIADGTGYDGSQSIRRTLSFVVTCLDAGGTLLLERSTTGVAPSMTEAARVNMGVFTAVDYACAPGVSLWAQASAGTINLEVLPGGERHPSRPIALPGGGTGSSLVLEHWIPLGAGDTFYSDPIEAGVGSLVNAASTAEGGEGRLFVLGSADLVEWVLLKQGFSSAGSAVFEVETDLAYVMFGYENGPNDQTGFLLEGWVD